MVIGHQVTLAHDHENEAWPRLLSQEPGPCSKVSSPPGSTQPGLKPFTPYY